MIMSIAATSTSSPAKIGTYLLFATPLTFNIRRAKDVYRCLPES